MKFLIFLLAIFVIIFPNLSRANQTFFIETNEEFVSISKAVSLLSKRSHPPLSLEQAVLANERHSMTQNTPSDTHQGMFRGYVLHLKKSVYSKELPAQDILGVERNGWFIQRGSNQTLEIRFLNSSRFLTARVSQPYGLGSERRCKFGTRASDRSLDRVGQGTLDYELKRALILNQFICIERF